MIVKFEHYAPTAEIERQQTFTISISWGFLYFQTDNKKYNWDYRASNEICYLMGRYCSKKMMAK